MPPRPPDSTAARPDAVDDGHGPPGDPGTAWHALPIDAVFERLRSSRLGLDDDEAARRRSVVGPNELERTRRPSPWRHLIGQFRNVLVVILLIAVALSAALGQAAEAIVIAVIVLFAALLGFVQEYRAERSLDALRRMAAPTATAIRGGREVEVPARDLVPGDVILLGAGDRIPADARLIEAFNLRVEEAALTGESAPVEKRAGTPPEARGGGGDRSNLVFAGTAVTYGRGLAVVVATGMATEFGQVARMLREVEPAKTPLQADLDRVGRALARVAAAAVVVIVLLGLARGRPWLDMVIFGIALAVAVVPEALPAVVTISLAIGVQRMARRNALVRRLPAVETLGCTSVICTDKTGTLTRDEMTARELLVAGERLEVTGAGYEPEGRFLRDGEPIEPSEPLRELLVGAVLSSDAHLVREGEAGRWAVRGDPTEGALVVLAAKAGLRKPELDVRYPRRAEIPFASETRRMTTLHAAEGGRTVSYSKGAAEVILESCTRLRTARGEEPLGPAEREAILAAARAMAGRALRVLAVARRRDATIEDAEREMTLLGLVGMIDPPRPEAGPALRACERAGIRVVMITGDHPITARAVGEELGLLASGLVVTGADLDAMDDRTLAGLVDRVAIYARVSPAHKLRVVAAMQGRGHVAAVTGDGVNDAPALKKAAIGIAMGVAGTDVSREAAAITLLDDNFASIVAAVEEGRGIFENIKKYLMYLLSSNLGEVGLMAGASLLGMPLPLSAVQLLYVNLATDGLPALALAVDPPEGDLMRRPPRDPRRGIFTRPVVALLTIGGIWSALVNLALFRWSLHAGRSLREAMTLAFVSLVLIQFFKAYSFRSDRHSVLGRPFANGWLNLAIAWEVALLALVVSVPTLNRSFGTVPPRPLDWLAAFALGFSVVPVLELGKWAIRRGWFGPTD